MGARLAEEKDQAMTEPLPLSDISVLEFSHAIMGPSTGMILGDLGANVIKIEPVPDGDRRCRAFGATAARGSRYGTNAPISTSRSG